MRLLLPLVLSLGVGTAIAADPVMPREVPAFDAALAQRTGTLANHPIRYLFVTLRTRSRSWRRSGVRVGSGWRHRR